MRRSSDCLVHTEQERPLDSIVVAGEWLWECPGRVVVDDAPHGRLQKTSQMSVLSEPQQTYIGASSEKEKSHPNDQHVDDKPSPTPETTSRVE